MTRPYQTKNIELAAVIQTLTGISPTLVFNDTRVVTFKFPSSSDVLQIVISYEYEILADARKLLSTRNMLFRRLREGAR